MLHLTGAQGLGPPGSGERRLWEMFSLFVWSCILHLHQCLRVDSSFAKPKRCAGCRDWRAGICRPASCVISTVVLSHRTADEWGWQRQRTCLWLWQWLPSSTSEPRHGDRQCLAGTFYLWPTCPNFLLWCVKCLLSSEGELWACFFKNCNLWGEGVLWQHYITEASRCWVIIIFRQLLAFLGCSKNSPCVWTLWKVTSIKVLSLLHS